jgi:hypothetical protein
MKRKKTILASVLGVIVGIMGTLGVMHICSILDDYFGPPRVTLMNASGEEISDVTISLGQATRDIPVLQDGCALTVPIRGGFSESSTHIAWTDSTGHHEESARDYMEAYGFYHARIVLTPDRKAKAIVDITESE